MTIGSRIRERRKALRLRQSDIAQQLGVAASAVSQWENDETEPDRTRIVPLAEYLQVTPQWLEFGELVPSKERKTAKFSLYEMPASVVESINILSEPAVPLLTQGREIPVASVKKIKVVGEVQAGLFKPAIEWPVGDQFELDVPIRAPFNRVPVFGLRIVGPSVEEEFPDGSFVICARLLDLGPLFELQNGHFVVVLRRDPTGDVEATVKEFQRDAEGNAWLWPRSKHPEFQTPWKVKDLANSDDNDDLAVWALVVADTRMRV